MKNALLNDIKSKKIMSGSLIKINHIYSFIYKIYNPIIFLRIVCKNNNFYTLSNNFV